MEWFKGMLVYVFVGIMTGVTSLDVYLGTEKRKQVPGNTDMNCSLPNVPNGTMTLSPLHIETLVKSEEMVWIGWQRNFTKWFDFRGCIKKTSPSEIRNKSIDVSDPFLDCYKFCENFSFMLSSEKCFCTITLPPQERWRFITVNSSFVGKTYNLMCMYGPLTNYTHEFDEKQDGNCLFAFKDNNNKLKFSNDLCKEHKSSVCVVLSRKEFMINDQRSSTWLNNPAVCEKIGTIFPSYSLIKEKRANADKAFKNDQQYWVAAFRRPLYTCLAADLYTNGTLGEPKSTSCNTKLRSLCIRSVESGGSQGNVVTGESTGKVELGGFTGNDVTGESTGNAVTGASTGNVVTGASTGNAVTGESTGNVVTGASTGNAVTGGFTGNAVTGESTGNAVTGESTRNDVTGESTRNDVTGESTRNDVTGESTGNVVTGESTRNVLTTASTGNVVTGESTGNVVTGKSTRNVVTGESTGNVEPGESMVESDQTPGYVWGIVVSVCVLCILISILLYLYKRKVSKSKNKTLETNKSSSVDDKTVSSTQTKGGVQPKRHDKSATIKEIQENEYHTIGASCHLAGSDGAIYHELHENPRSQETHDCGNYDHVTQAIIADNNDYDVFCKKGKSFNSDNVNSDYDTTCSIRQQIEGDYDTTCSIRQQIEGDYDTTCSIRQQIEGDYDTTFNIKHHIEGDYDTTFNIKHQIEGDYDTTRGQKIDQDLSECDSIAGPSHANSSI